MVGSGVIPRQYLAIRIAVKDIVLRSFFDAEFLETRIADAAATTQAVIDEVDLASKLTIAMNAPDFDGTLAAKLTTLGATPEGAMLQAMFGMFGGVENLVPVLKPMLLTFGADLANTLVSRGLLSDVAVELVTVQVARREIDLLMTEKLQYLTPYTVRRMLVQVGGGSYDRWWVVQVPHGGSRRCAVAVAVPRHIQDTNWPRSNPLRSANQPAALAFPRFPLTSRASMPRCSACLRSLLAPLPPCSHLSPPVHPMSLLFPFCSPSRSSEATWDGSSCGATSLVA
jgi:hypothetical protein